MNAARWRQIAELYEAANEREPHERLAFVAESTNDEELRLEVESLLLQDTSADNLLERIAAGSASFLAVPHFEVRGYRIRSVIGEGGMGLVYEAEQEHPRRTVALKVLKAGFASQELLSRFDRESAALGRLQHPGIARIFEAGTAPTELGPQPYFAMELIRGLSIVEHARQKKLDARKRIEMMIQVAEAVQHAHQRGIIHRDLKPSNILVDEEGQPKVLDFGVARIVDPDVQEVHQTNFGQMVGTPAYMSPEQAFGDPLEVDARSDIYSLGVILYELLAARLPYDVGRSALQAARVIQEETPARLGIVDRAFRGDLETIVAKALEKDKTRRYGSAKELAQDLARFLEGRAVLAIPDSFVYRARKFLRRNWVASSAVAAVVLALGVGLSAAVYQWRAAQREAQTSAAVEKFLTDIFRANSSAQQDPVKARQTTARQMLDIGSSKVDGELSHSPEAKKRLLETLSNLYLDLGLDDRAVELDWKNVALTKRLFGNNDLRVAASMVDLAGAMHASSSVNQEGKVLAEASRILDQRGDQNSLTRGLLDNKLAELYYSTNLDKAIEFARKSVAIYRQHPEGSDLVEALYEQGMIQKERDEYGEAAASLEEAIRDSRRIEGEPNPSLPRLYATLGETQRGGMDFARAEQSLCAALTAAMAVNGENHVDTVETSLKLGMFFGQTSRYKESLQWMQKARDIVLRIRGFDDPFYTPQVEIEYGAALARLGRLEDALVAINKAIENRRKNRPGTLYLGTMLQYRANALIETGDYAQAKADLDEALAIAEQLHTKDNSIDRLYRARLALAMDDPDKAAGFIGQKPKAEAGRKVALKFLRTGVIYSRVALARKDFAAAARIALEVRQQVISSSLRLYLREAEASSALTEAQARLGMNDVNGASPLAERAVELRKALSDPGNPALADAFIVLAECRAANGKTGVARELMRTAHSILAAHPRVGTQHWEAFQEAMLRLGGGQGVEVAGRF